MAEDCERLIEMVVESVRVHMGTGRYVLLLKEIGADRILPVWIGQWEAQAIAMRLQGITAERPLTHDLLLSALAELGARLDRVVITSLAQDTFHAALVLVTADHRYEVDARPSDAIALAVRIECPIYAAPEVLDQAATLPGEDERDPGPRPPDARTLRRPPAFGETAVPAEEGGEPVDPKRLTIFREFVNSLDLDSDQRGS